MLRVTGKPSLTSVGPTLRLTHYTSNFNLACNFSQNNYSKIVFLLRYASTLRRRRCGGDDGDSGGGDGDNDNYNENHDDSNDKDFFFKLSLYLFLHRATPQ